ncbi:SdrD B-like domain-containing protein [Lacihabitans sp. CCS-44]|uniref:SdrD B-like domain-containing protein n=1 Tax=Lacihabitans sp. CCS-44 TaxID=2487331 RepID=UPI0020CC5BD3|nr:SdrD B-like domain-containing protein [Lacihabitans sp. CCS-44]
MKTSFYTNASHPQNAADGDNSILNIPLLQGLFCKGEDSLLVEQGLNYSVGISKHECMINIDSQGKIPKSKNYNFIYPKLMKHLFTLNKSMSFLLHWLINFFKQPSDVKRISIFSSLKNGYKVSLAALVILVISMSSAFAAEVDLAIRQSVNNSTPTIGAPVRYTIFLVNEGNTTATNIVVEDIVPIGGMGSISATQTSGSWSYVTSTGVGTWTVPSLAGGDSVRLEINGLTLSPGVFFNLAEVKTSPDSDVDSVPGDTDLTEDDIATSCFSVPIQWYAGDEYTVEVPAPFSYGTGITWFRNNLPIGPSTPEATVNLDNSLTIRGVGSYTFTTSLTQCSATGCCPIILQQGPIFDLAFRKTPSSSSITAGGQVTYTFKAYNQGNIGATTIQISDYIPTGLTLADANWTQAGNVATLNTPIAAIAAGDSATRTITFNVSPAYTGSLSNSAELSSARGPVGEVVADIDSDLDNNPNNNGIAVDNAINENGKTGGDNDNSDVGVINVTPPPVFDLALRKTSIASSVVAGGQVTYDFEIINQGNQNATNIQISDYIPSGLTLADANWIQAGSVATLVTPFSLLTAGSTSNLSITFNVSPSATGSLTNSAEISSARGPVGEVVTDFDSTPDANSTNDGVSQDDVITGNGKTGGDEDDFDISTINISSIPVYDLALQKTLLNPGPYYPGSTVTYKIDVYNQGTVMATEVEITDYIPTGLVLADPDWTQVGSRAIYNNPNLVILAGQMVPLTIDFVVSPSFSGGTIRNSAEISRSRGPVGEAIVDVDSSPDNNQSNDGTSVDDVINQNGKTGGDEDDFDFGDMSVTPFASIGNFVWQDTNQNGVQDLGEPGISGVTVTLESPSGTFISNTTTASNGQYSFTGIIPGDYVVAFDRPSGYISSSSNSGANDSIDSDANATTGKTGTYSLVAGQSNQTIDAGFYVQSCADISTIAVLDGDICSGDSTYLTATSSNGIAINWYLVPSGGTPLFTSNSGQNQLVYPTTTTVYYAQLSTVSPGCPTDRTPIALVVNQRPLSPVATPSVEICIGETSDLNTHIINGTTSSGGVFEWHVGNLSTSALVANPSAVGAGTYYLFEKSLVGCYSNPAIIVVTEKNCAQVIDLSLLKTADKRTVNQNDNIIFTLQINNAGPDPATNVRIEDRLPSGLQFVSSSGLTNSSGLLSTVIPTIASGQTVYLTYTARAINGGTIINVAEVASADQLDSDSTPGNGATVNEDDDDDEVLNVIVPNPIADLSLQKLANNSTPSVGDNVIYTIRISNLGPNNATNVEITDILPAGLTLVSATGADQNLVVGSTVTASFATILANSSEEFYVTATVTGSGSIMNRAEVTKSDQQDPDSTPNNGGNEDDDDTNTITVQEPCNPTTPLISCANPYICPGENVSISAIGCNGTVVWSNGMTGNIITVNPTITTTYNARCQVGSCFSPNSNNVQIIVSSIVPPVVATSSTTVCAGGSVTLTASGCTGTVTWSNGMLGSSIVVNPTGSVTNYSATCSVLTCISNTSNIVSVTITGSPVAPQLAATNSNICSGQSTTLSATLCSGTVTWSNGQTGASITVSPLVTTNYTATCSLGSCISPVSTPLVINVGTSQTPSILASKDNTCGGEPVTLTVSNCTGGTLWSNGETTLSISVTPSATTVYSVTCGTGTCAATVQKTINVGGLGMTPTITASANNVCANTPVILTATSCTGTITWSLTSNTAITLGTGSTLEVSPITSVSYTATCATGTGCSGYASLNINVVSNSTPPIVTCGAERICAGDSLVFTAHNCSGTVNWSNGATGNIMVVRPVVNTTYSATCTLNSCVSPASTPVLITVLTQTPTITASSETVCSGGNTTLTASGCTGTLRWNTGDSTVSITVSPTVQTTYSATCTVEGCVGVASKIITIGTIQTPTLTASSNSVCAGTSVVLTATNCSSTLTWNTGQVGNTITVTPANSTSYSASCGSASCSGFASINITVSPAEVPVITTTNAFICVGQSTTLTASGCLGALTWSTGATTSSITVNPIANTTYTATCGTGSCLRSVSQEITVGTKTVPVVSASQGTVCANTPVVLTATNCSNGLIWNTGATTGSITVTPAITTIYSATCGTGTCAAADSVTVTVSGTSITEMPTITTNKAPTICLGDSVILTASTSGSYTHIWSNGATTRSITVKASGSYSVQYINAGGCRSANSAAVAVIANNCDTTQAVADIGVTISGNKTSVVIGDTVIYTIQVKNNGPSNATNVVVLNEVPEGLTILGGTPGLLTEGSNLKVTISALAVGESKTYTYSTKLTKAGSITNVVKKISADQTDPVVINNMDEFTIECVTCQESCVSTAFKADTIRQTNGSYNIKFTALIKNCGNVALDSLELVENLSAMFPSPTQFTIVQKPTPNTGSTLAGNDSFNGSTNTAVLNRLTSKLPVGKTDTVVFIINLLPMGTEGPYSTNTIVKAVGKTVFAGINVNQEVSDVSNDGGVIVKALSDPTVVRLFKSPSIAIVLSVKDTVKQGNGSYNVTFQAIVKNNGSVDLNNVLVTDTLSKYFGDPASYTMVGTPGLNLTSTLVSNPAYNGSSDPRLTLPSSNLPIGKQDTIIFVMNLVTGDKKEFQDQAIATGIGNLSNGTTSTVVDVSNSGVNPDTPGSVPTQLIFNTENQGSEITACVGLALTTINKTKLDDGTYNVTFQAIVQNCGNLTLTNVSICDTLSNTFSSPTEVRVIVKPFTSAGSSLAVDTSFNGVTNTCLLKSASSSLIPGKIDTLKWTINIKLNSNNGPFRNNVTVNSTSPSGQIVSDISNDGINPAPAGSNPTILNFNDNIPDELIGLAKNLVGITKVPNRTKVFDVEFSFVMKNYGIVPFSKVQLQDNLAYTFGDKVIIDSVYVKDPETGLVANTNYTGKGELTNVLADSLSSLPLNTTKTIGMVVRVDMSQADTLRYENIALGIGYFTGGSTSDPSADGTNPDANLSGDPSDDSDPTVIDFTGLLDLTPITPLGIAKSVDTLGSADGSYLLTYKVIVKNYGTTRLDSVQLTDDLADVFSNKTQFVLMGTPTLSDSSTLKINASFDGDTVKTLLVAAQSTLPAGASDTITFKVKVINNDLEAQTYLNTINGTALSDTVLVSDKSSVGLVPDKNNDGNPGNDNEPTGITIEPASEDTSAVNVIVYGGVSPNGDGLNDVLVIKDKDNTVNLTEDDNISIYIYNRWGHLVYKSENYFKDFPQDVDSSEPNGWDGSSNTGIRVEKDKYVPDGTYYYVVASTNPRLFGGKPFVNFITVKR